MKKIVIDARGFRGSDGEYVQNLLEHLDAVDKNLSHRYVVLMNPKDIAVWHPKSKRFSKVASRSPAFTFREQFTLAWQLYRQNAQLVHFTTPSQPLLYFRAKITTIHDLNTLRFRSHAKHRIVTWAKHQRTIWTHRYAIGSSRRIIAPSQYIKTEIAKYAHANSRKIRVIHDAADPLTATPTPLAELQERRFLLYLGRPVAHKNLGTLLDAFALLQPANPELYLVLAGRRDSLYKPYERLVGKRDLNERVVFTDYVTDGTLRWLYEQCQALVIPSLSEGFGLIGIEGMHHGAPVVCSGNAVFPEIYGEAAAYFDPQSAEAMATAIRDVINHAERRKTLSQLGKRQALKYSWRKSAEQTLALYKEILREVE